MAVPSCLIFITFVCLTCVASDNCHNGYQCIEADYCKSSADYLSTCGKYGFVCCPLEERRQISYLPNVGKKDSRHQRHEIFGERHNYDGYQNELRYQIDASYPTFGQHNSPFNNHYESGQSPYSYDRYGGRPFEDYGVYGQYERIHDRDYYEDVNYGPKMSHEAQSFLRSYKYAEECGIKKNLHRHIKPRVSTGHVVESGIAEYAEFPWQAAIFHKADEKIRTRYGYLRGYKFHCGGTIINSAVVLTAAHCVEAFKRSELIVKLGEWNLKGSQGELFPAINRKIKRIIVHERYDHVRLQNDAAILILDRPVRFTKTPHISPVCLPPDDLKIEQYSKCYIAGWGEDPFKPNYGSNLLKKASVNLQKNEDCKALVHKVIRNLDEDFYHKSYRCFTGGYGKDACVGDGGGAVVCPISNEEAKVCEEGYGCEDEHYFIVGIISWGNEDCGDEDSVTVISDVIYLHDWIERVLRPAGGLKAHNHRYWYKDDGYGSLKENYDDYYEKVHSGQYGYEDYDHDPNYYHDHNSDRYDYY